jgi:formylglycine-generating enzyme required for sulfatase activity
LLHKLFGYDTSVLDSFAVHAGNSGSRTQPPEEKEANPFGLVNMLGNVREFTLDWYAEDTYGQRAGAGPALDPRGPETGMEHVIRGGSFRSSPVNLRAAERDFTRSDACLRTDPQIPKSIWWYSDCDDIGFRVVRAFEDPGSGGQES